MLKTKVSLNDLLKYLSIISYVSRIGNYTTVFT